MAQTSPTASHLGARRCWRSPHSWWRRERGRQLNPQRGRLDQVVSSECEEMVRMSPLTRQVIVRQDGESCLVKLERFLLVSRLPHGQSRRGDECPNPSRHHIEDSPACRKSPTARTQRNSANSRSVAHIAKRPDEATALRRHFIKTRHVYLTAAHSSGSAPSGVFPTWHGRGCGDARQLPCRGMAGIRM